MLKRLATRAGIYKRVHTHGLRHMHAAQQPTEGVDIAIISPQLGQSSINITARDIGLFGTPVPWYGISTWQGCAACLKCNSGACRQPVKA